MDYSVLHRVRGDHVCNPMVRYRRTGNNGCGVTDGAWPGTSFSSGTVPVEDPLLSILGIILISSLQASLYPLVSVCWVPGLSQCTSPLIKTDVRSFQID